MGQTIHQPVYLINIVHMAEPMDSGVQKTLIVLSRLCFLFRVGFWGISQKIPILVIAFLLSHFLKTLTLAGVLPLARIFRTLAGRLALARIDTIAVNFRFVRESGRRRDSAE